MLSYSFLVRPAGSGWKALLPGILVAAASKKRQVALTAGIVLGYLFSSALLVAPMLVFLKPRYLKSERRLIFVQPTRKQKRPGARTIYGHIMTMFGCMVLGPLCHPLVLQKRRDGDHQRGRQHAPAHHAAKEARLLPLCFFLGALGVFALLASLLVVLVIATGVWNAKFMGVIASVVTCLASIFVIVDIVEVLKTRRASSSLYALAELVVNIFTAATWTYCAFLATPVDLYSGIPCAIGFVFLSVQLGVSLRYRIDDDDFNIELQALFESPV